MSGSITRALAGACCAACLAAPAAAQDFGDQASSTLTTRAWRALERGDVTETLASTAKCRELHADEAARQQAELTEFLPRERGHDAWALNDVGTCCYIEGQALEKADRKAEAVAAYRRLVAEFGFAQCWDERGWFWHPAEAAQERLDALEFDTALAE
jgi:hypothetical protein